MSTCNTSTSKIEGTSGRIISDFKPTCVGTSYQQPPNNYDGRFTISCPDKISGVEYSLNTDSNIASMKLACSDNSKSLIAGRNVETNMVAQCPFNYFLTGISKYKQNDTQTGYTGFQIQCAKDLYNVKSGIDGVTLAQAAAIAQAETTAAAAANPVWNPMAPTAPTVPTTLPAPTTPTSLTVPTNLTVPNNPTLPTLAYQTTNPTWNPSTTPTIQPTTLVPTRPTLYTPTTVATNIQSGVPYSAPSYTAPLPYQQPTTTLPQSQPTFQPTTPSFTAPVQQQPTTLPQPTFQPTTPLFSQPTPLFSQPQPAPVKKSKCTLL
jgi:hypothetical protein